MPSIACKQTPSAACHQVATIGLAPLRFARNKSSSSERARNLRDLALFEKSWRVVRIGLRHWVCELPSLGSSLAASHFPLNGNMGHNTCTILMTALILVFAFGLGCVILLIALFVENWSETVLQPISQSADQTQGTRNGVVPVCTTGIEMADGR